jgi:hypothetical protein
MTRVLCRAALVAVSLLLLAGCQKSLFQPVQCPQIKPYSDPQLDAIQRSINALPQNDPLRAAMQDYEDLRDDARVCNAMVRHGS